MLNLSEDSEHWWHCQIAKFFDKMLGHQSTFLVNVTDVGACCLGEAGLETSVDPGQQLVSGEVVCGGAIVHVHHGPALLPQPVLVLLTVRRLIFNHTANHPLVFNCAATQLM